MADQGFRGSERLRDVGVYAGPSPVGSPLANFQFDEANKSLVVQLH